MHLIINLMNKYKFPFFIIILLYLLLYYNTIGDRYMFPIFLSFAREMARNYNVTISRFHGSRLARFSDQGDNGLISGKSIRKKGANGRARKGPV